MPQQEVLRWGGGSEKCPSGLRAGLQCPGGCRGREPRCWVCLPVQALGPQTAAGPHPPWRTYREPPRPGLLQTQKLTPCLGFSSHPREADCPAPGPPWRLQARASPGAEQSKWAARLPCCWGVEGAGRLHHQVPGPKAQAALLEARPTGHRSDRPELSHLALCDWRRGPQCPLLLAL